MPDMAKTTQLKLPSTADQLDADGPDLFFQPGDVIEAKPEGRPAFGHLRVIDLVLGEHATDNLIVRSADDCVFIAHAEDASEEHGPLGRPGLKRSPA
jgi:hypothetical protein